MSINTHGIVQCLARAEAFSHPVSNLEVIETHISYVILTGEFAYKIRKDVSLGFLDFSTLELRRHDCEEELRLNQRLAPDLYLAVVPITGTLSNPQMDGKGEAIEYAVKMKQFAPQDCLDKLIEHNAVSAQHFARLAETLADFHASAAKVNDKTDFGTEAAIWHYTQQNFQQIRERLEDPDILSQLASLENRSRKLHQELTDEFIQRRAEGWIRECHGDLHLANLVMINDEIVPFDCLEFSAELRWIDTISELAFLCMDLIARGHSDFAQVLLNHYLAYSGDYMGLSLLPYYLAYRAMVRAKVAAINYAQHSDDADSQAIQLRELQQYLTLADGFLQHSSAPQIILMQGVSGSGKTWLAEQIAANSNVIHIRSDVERKRLLGLKPNEATDQSAQCAYSPQLSHLTYQRLMALCYAITDAGFSVIVDATFLDPHNRMAYLRLSRVAGITMHILSVTAPRDVLMARVRQRLEQATDASEATAEVLEQQLSEESSFNESEEPLLITIDTAQPIDIATLIRQLELSRWPVAPSTSENA